MNYQLRSDQTDLLDVLSQFWKSGNGRVMLQLPTGGGKTMGYQEAG